MILEFIIALAVWLMFTFATSKVEASLFHYRNISSKRQKLNEHAWLTVIRIAVIAGIYAYTDEWILIPAFAAIFPFFHDGWYYEFRHKIDSDIYVKGFFDESTSSTAKLEFSFWQRTVIAFAGVITIVTYLIFK